MPEAQEPRRDRHTQPDAQAAAHAPVVDVVRHHAPDEDAPAARLTAAMNPNIITSRAHSRADTVRILPMVHPGNSTRQAEPGERTAVTRNMDLGEGHDGHEEVRAVRRLVHAAA